MMVLKILILFILVLFPFGELLRIQLNNHVVIKPLDVVVGVTALWWLILQVNNSSIRYAQDKRLKVQSFFQHKKSFAFSLTLFVIIGFVSLLLNLTWLKSQEFLVSLLYLLRFVSYALLLPIVLQFDKQFKKMVSIFLFIDGLILLVLGYVQYFFFNSLKFLYYLGWDEHLHRIVSTFLDPNFAGAFFVLYFLFTGIFVYDAVKKKNQKKLIFFCLVAGFTLLAIFLTFSRSALLTLVVGSVAFLFLINKKRFIFFIFTTIVLFGIIASPKFYDENMNLFREASSKARLDNYKFALRVIQDRPILGVGFNSYRYTKPLYGVDYDWVDAPSHADAGVDNSYLFVLATTGIFGFFAYGLMWVRLLKKAFFLHRKKMLIGSSVIIASSFALFINALFINSLFYAPLMLWIWMLWGVFEELRS